MWLCRIRFLGFRAIPSVSNITAVTLRMLPAVEVAAWRHTTGVFQGKDFLPRLLAGDFSWWRNICGTGIALLICTLGRKQPRGLCRRGWGGVWCPCLDVATCFSCQISDFTTNVSEAECSGWDPSGIFGHSHWSKDYVGPGNPSNPSNPAGSRQKLLQHGAKFLFWIFWKNRPPAVEIRV